MERRPGIESIDSPTASLPVNYNPLKLLAKGGRHSGLAKLSRKRLQDHYFQNFAHDKLAEAYIELIVGPKQPPITETGNRSLRPLTANSIGFQGFRQIDSRYQVTEGYSA